MCWAAAELKEIDLGDRRLNKRAIALLDTLAAKPTMSIPSACSGWSETIAGYRFLANDGVTWEGLLAPQWACSRTRIACHKVVLMLQPGAVPDSSAAPGFAALPKGHNFSGKAQG